MPTYRRTTLLLRAVESALRARPPGVELSLIVVDNCSPHSPAAILRDHFGGSVALFVNDRNIGMPGNWTRCRELAQASGADYWMLLEDDNLLEPAFLTEAISALEADQGADIFFSACTYFDDAGNTTPWQMWSVDGGALRPGRQADRELLGWAFTCAMRASAVLVRNTPAMKGLPVFDVDHLANHDVSGLGGQAIAARGVWYDERPLMRYYVNPVSMTATATGDPRALFAELLRALRSNAIAIARSRRLNVEDWRRAARHVPLDRLMVAVLATEPGHDRSLAGPHRALIEGLVERSRELSGAKRFATKLFGAPLWRAVSILSRGRARYRRPARALADFAVAGGGEVQ